MSTLRVSGKKFHLDDSKAAKWHFEVRPGGWVIATDLSDPKQSRHRLAMSDLKGKLSFTTLYHSGVGEILKDSQGTSAARGGVSQAAIEADLTAQFPGKVRKILVAEGSMVSEGEPLLLVEAMKMEFAIKAPIRGKVVRFLVKESQQLAPGDRFLEFDPEGK